MVTVRNYGTGTGWSSSGIVGAKTTFGENEKVYAEIMYDSADPGAVSKIRWFRRVEGAWSLVTEYAWTNTPNYTTFYHWSWIQDWPQGEWRVQFLYNGAEKALAYFTIVGLPPVPLPPENPAYWMARGYAVADATKIASWCITNRMTPTPAQIAIILAPPTPPPTPPLPIPVPAPKPLVDEILGGIWDYFTKTVPEFYGAQPEALLIPFAGIAQGLEALGPLFAGTTATTSTAGKALISANVPAAIAKTIASKSWIDAIIAGIKANPLMTVFVATEIPNLIQMTQFARNQIAQSTGQTLPQIQAQLTTLENAVKNAGYDFDAAIKAKNTAGASAILTGMKGTLGQYKATIDANRSWLTNAGTLANAEAIYGLYSSTTASLEAQLPAAPADIAAQLLETMPVQITKVTDADTVQATTQGIPSLVFDVRILGLNAPDKDLTVVWVKSKIDGVETRYTLASADYKAANTYAVANLQRAYVTLLIDPADKVDKYGRALAAVRYGVGSGDYAIDMVRKGLAVAYLEGTNKYVNAAAFKAAQAAAMAEKLGLWKTIAAQNTGKLKISSSPSNAKLYIGGAYTNHLTPETMTLGEGTHEVKVTKTGYEPLVKYLTVVKGETVEDLFELQKTALGVPGVPSTVTGPAPAGFSISVDSVPTRAKLSIDNVYTRHYTPSDAKELRDVMSLLAPGSHKFSASKSGMYAEVTVQIVAGANEPIVLTLA